MPEKEVNSMPKKPKKPCAYPGCPKLTDGLYCEEHKKVTNQQYERVEHVHHIKPLEEGGTNDFDNLKSLCQTCHSRIHALRGDYWHK